MKRSITHLWSSACLLGFRYRSLLVAMPLCSSACLFALRLALSTFGVDI